MRGESPTLSATPPIALYSAILPPITADGRNVTK
ncbi:hypothetical protein GGE43_004729 [Agrobacterium tumefaciens]|uniref:Uncharacterized protein n=1 Tax=Agrobacterium radiobacter TaxID=362 RepID=A0ABR6J7Z9_AGRRD|nr:hypothetical protein [Agrobacterium radiobacter]MBB4319579.1 hypothetical protein [Agrobacterium radiobacter]MBB4325967.1 hypothetical protein [Agrobacterium radiobacter]MBB4337889.1 hypothetical protein [Agrobacterium radiobacter]MBB4459422.1 hypothetical protein [Agrobacterium radiobacter]